MALRTQTLGVLVLGLWILLNKLVFKNALPTPNLLSQNIQGLGVGEAWFSMSYSDKSHGQKVLRIMAGYGEGGRL